MGKPFACRISREALQLCSLCNLRPYFCQLKAVAPTRSAPYDDNCMIGAFLLWLMYLGILLLPWDFLRILPNRHEKHCRKR